MKHVIPGGKKKGLPIESAEVAVGDLEYWHKRLTDDLAKDPNKQFADKDRALLPALAAELTRRKGGGKAAPTQALARVGAESEGVVLAGSWFDPKTIDAELQKAVESMHLISPATVCGSLPEGCEVAISLVYVDGDDSRSGPGEVYSVGGGKVGLSGTTIKRIGVAAGIDWDPSQSGILDDQSEQLYCHFRAVGTLRNFDGSHRTVSGEVVMDLRDGSPQVAAMFARAKGDQSNVESQLRDMRLFIHRHAETKAKLRAIADGCALRRSFTAGELQKPFAVARLMATGRTNDPALREKFALMNFDKMTSHRSELYGKPAPHALGGQRAPQFRGHAPPVVNAPVSASALIAEPLDDDEPYSYDVVDGVGETPAHPTANTEPAPAAAAAPASGAKY